MSYTLYVLSYNCPEQFNYWVTHCPEVQETAAEKILVNNTNRPELREGYDWLCRAHGFEQIRLNNHGIMGGRIAAAEHFVNRAETDLSLYFEDDYITNTASDELCRSGYPKSVDGWLRNACQIVKKESLDYLKLSFSEVFYDNDVQVSWFNVSPADKRRYFRGVTQPPATNFTAAKILFGLGYFLGEVYWCSWPQITTKDGNRALLRPDFRGQPEMYLMAELYKQTLSGRFRPGVLKASLVSHQRMFDYDREARKL